MPTRSHTSFKKRQKEIARMEKQRDKAAKRMQKKLAPPSSESDIGEPIDLSQEPDLTQEPDAPRAQAAPTASE